MPQQLPLDEQEQRGVQLHRTTSGRIVRGSPRGSEASPRNSLSPTHETMPEPTGGVDADAPRRFARRKRILERQLQQQQAEGTVQRILDGRTQSGSGTRAGSRAMRDHAMEASQAQTQEMEAIIFGTACPPLRLSAASIACIHFEGLLLAVLQAGIHTSPQESTGNLGLIFYCCAAMR